MAPRKSPPAARRPPGRPPRIPPGTPPEEIPLSDNERLFVEEWLVDRNTTHAYMRTFPDCVNYSTAARNGSRLRHQPNVAREIHAALAAQAARVRVRGDNVVRELARIAFSDILDLFDPRTNQLRNPRNIPLDTRRVISSITVTRERRSVTQRGRTRTTVTESEVKYTLWNKMEALKELSSYLGLNAKVTPLEAFLQALPTQLREAVRLALEGAAGGGITTPALENTAPPAPASSDSSGNSGGTP